MTARETERLLDLLLKLSEECPPTDGRLRDEIAHVRDYLWDKSSQADPSGYGSVRPT